MNCTEGKHSRDSYDLRGEVETKRKCGMNKGGQSVQDALLSPFS